MILEPLIDRIFRSPCGGDPFEIEIDHDLVAGGRASALDTVDAVIAEPRRLAGLERERIGHGWHLVFSNSFSDLPFAYADRAVPVARRAESARRLSDLYRNHFQACARRLEAIGDGRDGALGTICHMLWDLFPLYPGNAERAVIEAGAEGMFEVLDLGDESCVVGALHALGRGRMHVPGLGGRIRAAIGRRWSPAVREYAEAAARGCVQ